MCIVLLLHLDVSLLMHFKESGKGQEGHWYKGLLRGADSLMDLLNAVRIFIKGCLESVKFDVETLLVAYGFGSVCQGGQNILLDFQMMWPRIQIENSVAQPSVYSMSHIAIWYSVSVGVREREVAVCLSLHSELDVVVYAVQMVQEIFQPFCPCSPIKNVSTM